MDKGDIRKELVDEMVAECKLQIKNRESKRDTEYRGDSEQAAAFDNQIRYYEFMIVRLEGYEKRKESGLSLLS